MNPSRLQSVNESLSALGYLPIAEAQLQALQTVLGDYEAMLSDCRQQRRDSMHWEAIRSAQFGASGPCDQVLRVLGISAPLASRVRVLIRTGSQLRVAMATIIKLGLSSASAAQIDFVRAAFAEAGDPKRAAAAASIAASVHKVHGARYALAFEETRTPGGKPTLQIEAAERVPGSRAFDWNRKVAVQLVDHELVELMAVLRGQQPSAAFGHHGAARDKFVEFSAQEGGFHAVVRQGRVARAVAVPRAHSFRLMTMVISVLRGGDPSLTAELVVALAAQAALQPP